MLFYDIEAFPHYWCVVVVDDETSERHVFEDVPSLRDFYKKNRKQTWVGYNSRQYDAPMLRFIMLGLDPYKCSQDLIVLGKKWFEFGYNVTEAYKRIPLRNFDCVLLNKGLKKLEGFRGSSIKESTISWDLDRPLTREEKDEVIDYCTHDVLECRKVFYDTVEEYEAHEALVQAFDIDDSHFSKSKAQLVALILKAQKKSWFDEWDFSIVNTLVLNKYQHIRQWYENPDNHSYSNQLKIDVAGVPHVFAWGGIHGAIPRYNGEGYYVNMDVASYYPALMIEYGFLSRNVPDPEIYRQIRDTRIVLKKNKDPKQLPYKIVLNSTYGAMKDRYNNLFDPRQANNVCINGQLLLLDLIEKMEPYCDLIQSNTDGILVKLRADNDKEAEQELSLVKSIAAEWSARTRMDLEFEMVKKVFQKDVNNYLTIDENGKYKSKGAVVKQLSTVDYDLPIVNEAIVNYMVNNVPIEDTINNCNDLIKFQKIVMVSSKYKGAITGTPIIGTTETYGKTKTKKVVNVDGAMLKEKHIRWFASTNENHGGLFKIHAVTGSYSKVTDSPERLFIVNTDVTQSKCSDYPDLDKEFYIKLAHKRIKGFYSKAV